MSDDFFFIIFTFPLSSFDFNYFFFLIMTNNLYARTHTTFVYTCIYNINTQWISHDFRTLSIICSLHSIILFIFFLSFAFLSFSNSLFNCALQSIIYRLINRYFNLFYFLFYFINSYQSITYCILAS